MYTGSEKTTDLWYLL